MYNGHLVLPFYSKGLSSFDKWIKVKKLTIYMNSSHRTNLDVILCFPNLIDLAIEFDHSSQLNRFLYIRLGRIQHLRLAFFNPVTLDLIKQIEDIFNLQELITFQLHLWNEEAYPRLLENSLQNLISTLSSVQNLSLICKPVQFGNIIKNLKPNSLTSFYVRIVGIMDKPLAIETILINQHQSIKQLFYCYVSPSSPSKRVYGIEEFDKVFKVKSNTYLDDLLDGLNEIKTILYHAGRFPNLDQVFYNDYCYFIERISDKIYISPSNNVISTCCIRPY
ncbi:uncharacterized protein SPAPADRAFT_158578 [Spathaspora passalidarum NRRL Y-27907]|uniref:Uncharacterized protein n=1 Tax=Spathaspora passalidarum (strain NRRL Y-27907 / 11-Y1) TaxID=619300 RepID=G3AV42_SPAPN|nr:uncharacterized protein SPAPADRAFT_158578 [Spathaspora passalidarum NRRL Y-27907]EGW30116.1 hypothetical protein SPAPADRAFT_158578 [Spathaspora passalidarum NRRL Y-27907]